MSSPFYQGDPAIDTVKYTARAMQSQDCLQTTDLISKFLLKQDNE